MFITRESRRQNFASPPGRVYDERLRTFRKEPEWRLLNFSPSPLNKEPLTVI